ncbi:MAG: hypothetical protein ACODAB_07990 [Gemmatimonadota bacterium]
MTHADPVATDAPIAAKDLLVADLNHFGESMFHNENVGEKRFAFFVTLVTAVGAGLVGLAGAEEVSDALFRTAAAGATASLLVLGFFSYLRMVHRNRVTDEYQRTLGYLRRKYVDLCPELAPYSVPDRRPTRAGKWLRGGYAETMAAIEGLLAVGFLMLVLDVGLALAVAVGAAVTAGLWIAAADRDKGDRELAGRELTARDAAARDEPADEPATNARVRP